MVPHAVLLVVVGAASASVPDEGTVSLADAVRAINDQAAKFPESRGLKPLTQQQVVKSIAELDRKDRLSDAEYRQLKQIVETRRLPGNVVLRQFVRYNEGTCVRHGWWVRLMLLRDNRGPFTLTIREEPVFRRPYTQMERFFQEEVRQGGMGTLSRLVAYFDEDPKFAEAQRYLPQETDRLAKRVQKAINDRKAEDLIKTYYWEGVDEATRTAVRTEAEKLAMRQLSSVDVCPRRFGGRLQLWRGLKTWGPNLPVLGYLVLEFNDRERPRSVWLEFGEMQGRARLVNYIVTHDDSPQLIGKRLSKPIRVYGGGSTVHPEKGWSEFHVQIDAPDELPALQQANFEIWRHVPPSAPRKTKPTGKQQ
jgi:hypothetical protein